MAAERVAMYLKPRVLLLLPCILLAACVSQQETAAQKAVAERTAQVSREKHCGTFGYKPGTTDYSRCLENLYVQDQQKAAFEAAERRARADAAADGLIQAGAALSAIGQSSGPEYRQSPFPPEIRCNTFRTTTICQ